MSSRGNYQIKILPENHYKFQFLAIFLLRDFGDYSMGEVYINFIITL